MRTDHHKTKFEMIKIDAWRSNFEELLGENRDDFKMTEVFEQLNVGFQITSTEIKKKALREGENGRSPVSGGLNLEMLK